MRAPRGIRARLTLGLLLIVGGALLVASLLVVPFLERQLVDAKLDQLEENAERTAAVLASGSTSSDAEIVRAASSTFGARVVLYQVFSPPLTLGVITDSSDGSPGALARDPVALAAAQSGKARGRATREGMEVAEAAVQLFTGDVLLLSAPLADQLETVEVVKQRLLIATIAALLVAGLLGSWAAGVHARRIGRIERAAERIAEGHFDEPIGDAGDDELGQLAASFDRMRVQLRQLDQARKEFVANASHELRTPLFSLAGFLELLEDEELDDETRAGFLATTREQVARLTRLATDLLDLSRLDAGHLRVERVEVSLAEVVEALGDELAPIADATGHVLLVEASPDAWAVADEERTLQIGRALAGNALAHTPPGTTVRLSARAVGGDAVLEVHDDGPGVPVEEQERIFDRFYRVDTANAHGSGLGLAIAREVAGLMDGRLTVTSASGETTFALALPAAAPVGDPVST
jgi:signal transduction histidine kinase